MSQEQEVVEYNKKIEILKTKHKKEFNKYFRAMSYQIMSVEVEALYNILVSKKESECELTRRWEATAREILSR